MSDEKKVHKRKNLVRYLALAACILIIAAVTVIAVAAANNWWRNELTIEAGGNSVDKDKDKDKNPGGNEDKEPDKNPDKDPGKDPGKDDDKTTSSDTSFLMPVSYADVTFEYDFICNPSMCGVWYFHEALDMVADAGTQVVSCLDGTVENITRDDYLNGTSVTISHKDGVSTVYTFIDVADTLKVGDKVSRGDVIGTVSAPCGNEYLQGSHLHFAVMKNGTAENPADYLNVSIK